MPRVIMKTKSTRGGKYTCVGCGKTIEPGTKYYQWAFFRARTPHRQCMECGSPRQSQLTQSKLSSVYAAIEAAESDLEAASTPSDLAEALNHVAEEARQIANEYNDAAEAMGAAGEGSENQERGEQLGDFADSLESAASDIESEEDEWKEAVAREEAKAAKPDVENGPSADDVPDEFAEDAPDDDDESLESADDIMERLRGDAESALGEMPL